MAQPRRLTIGDLCLAIVGVAGAAALARYREIWLALDAINIGYPAAIGLYLWFWVGLALVARRAETKPGRFFGLGGLFLSMVVLPLPFPRTQVGIVPNYPGYFTAAMLLGCLMFVGAGALAGLLQSVPVWRARARRRA